MTELSRRLSALRDAGQAACMTPSPYTDPLWKLLFALAEQRGFGVRSLADFAQGPSAQTLYKALHGAQKKGGYLGVARAIANALGYEIAHASSADQALKLAATMNLSIDLLVVDQDLPGKGGLQLLYDLRARGQNMCAVIVAASPSPEPTDMGPGVVLLRKPFQLADLRNAIGELNKAPKAGSPV